MLKTIVAIEADFERSPAGTTSRLADDLAGIPVLRRTVQRVLRTANTASVHVVVPTDQHARAESLLHDLPVKIETHQAGPPPGQALIQTARKWSLDGWRGGIGGACWFDEQTHTPVLAALGQREKADGVLLVPAAAVLVDPELLSGMVEHYASVAGAVRMTFAPAPPGLAGLVIRPDLLEELARAGQPPSYLLAYRPDDPQGGYLNRNFCYLVPNPIARTSARLLADTDQSMAMLRAFMTDNGSGGAECANAEAICAWYARRVDATDALPSEVELELTPEDQLFGSLLRPRGRDVPQRGPLSLDCVGDVVDALSRRDTSLLVLGGFGEPLLHPEFPAVLERCRPRGGRDDNGVYGLAVRTNGLGLDRAMVERLASHQVDVVLVTIDAHKAETYHAVHALDAFETVQNNIEAMNEFRRETNSIRPLLVPELVKARETYADMEPFYDTWMRRLGAAVISGYSHHAGQRPERAVMNMAPAHRGPCRRLGRRCMVLADGRVVSCDQDCAAKQVLGNLGEESLTAVWGGERARQLREAHKADRLDSFALCPHCDEWHRP